jgi:hypothetical protein
MKITAVCLLAIFCAAACADDSLSTAVNRISKVGVFAFGGVGFIGKISQGEIDFRVIQAQPPALALSIFEEMFANGSPAAKSYALAGIRQFDPDRSKQLLASLHGSTEKVMIMQGCIIEDRPLIEIAKAIDSGSYDDQLKRAR